MKRTFKGNPKYEKHTPLNLQRLIDISRSNADTNNVRRARLKLNILVRDNFCCVICKSNKELTIDHVFERSNGKRNASDYKVENCVALCSSCHQRKNKKVGNDSFLRKYLTEKNKETHNATNTV